jgi:hypothetical protein
VSGNNPFSNSNVFIAQDFELGASSTITALTFDVLTTTTTVPTTDVYVKFYDNNAGQVGTQTFSTDASVASSVSIGTTSGFDITRFTVNLPNVSLAAGVHWLGLQVDPAQWDMHWAIPSSGSYGISGYESSSGDTGTYGFYSYEHSFELIGAPNVAAVPLPTAALAGSALIGCFGLLRSKARRAIAF